LSNRNTLLESQAIFTNEFMCKCVKEYGRSGGEKIYLYILVFICRLSIIFEKVIEEGGKNFQK